ncbi:MAG: hypothetical protein K6C12_05900 [Oscillospiraceae bacterium]|nr:hypothetical protein [Oscillospiraceae bacterium]
MKRFTVLVSLLLILSLLTGCGSGAVSGIVPAETLSDLRTDSDVSHRNMESETTASDPFVWQARRVPVEGARLTAELKNGTPVGNRIYFTSIGVLEDRTPEGVTPEWPEQFWVYGPVLCAAETDGSMTAVPYTPVPEAGTGVLYEGLCAGAEGSLWLLEKHYRKGEVSSEFSALTPAGSAERMNLVHLREDGTVIASFPLEGLAGHADEVSSLGGNYALEVSGMAADSEGNICIGLHEWFAGNGSYVQDNRIIVLSADSGMVKQTVSVSGTLAYMAPVSDGSVAVAHYQGSNPAVGILNTQSGALQDVAAIDDFINCMTTGRHAGSICYGAGDSFWELDLSSGEQKKLLDWTACGVSHGEGDSVCLLSDGEIITTEAKETRTGIENGLIFLEAVPAADVQEQKVLRMAVLNLYPFTGEMISRFNRSNSEYRIEVTDYSQYNDYSSGREEDWNAGLTRLQTEVIAGKIPDILDVSLLPVDHLGAKGLLEDLYPYIDGDPELDRSQLLEHVVSAFEDNGKLYQTVGNFYVLTTAGLSREVGNEMGWSMEQLEAAMRNLQLSHPEATVLDPYMTRDDVMTFLLYLEQKSFVDWETGECSFDSGRFRDFLSFVSTIPTSYDLGSFEETDSDTRILMGQQLMKMCNFSRFEDLQANTAGLGGEDCCFIGYPTSEGVGSMFAQIGNTFAISSACADKEAAWQFVRQFFLPDYQEQFVGSVFPTNRMVYEEMKQDAMSERFQRNPDGSFALDLDGKRIPADLESVNINGSRYSLRPVTEEEIARIEEIIERTEHVLGLDDSLKSIITEGAAGYLAGQRPVEDAVTQIQSRARLYVNEQR